MNHLRLTESNLCLTDKTTKPNLAEVAANARLPPSPSHVFQLPLEAVRESQERRSNTLLLVFGGILAALTLKSEANWP